MVYHGVNRYPGDCGTCGKRVARNAGSLWRAGRRYVAYHLACKAAGEARVIEVRTSGGTFIQNSRGRCEDAPCCGCCTI